MLENFLKIYLVQINSKISLFFFFSNSTYFYKRKKEKITRLNFYFLFCKKICNNKDFEYKIIFFMHLNCQIKWFFFSYTKREVCSKF